MRRMHRYTLICFLIAVGFILGSMEGMNFILQEKESRLLQESGTARMESPVTIWQETKETGRKGTDEEAEQEERQLTIEQIEEVISYRADTSPEILHEPVEGQISMEDAIASGENWLVEMGFAKKDSETFARRASLSLKKNQEISDVSVEPYYSFWTVRFSDKFMYAVLYVNAVTGRVWDAEITLYRDKPSDFSLEKLNTFLELTGIQDDTDNFVEINETNTQARLRIKNSRLCAEMKFYDIVVSYKEIDGSWNSDAKEYQTKVVDVDEVVEHNEDEDIDIQKVIRYHLIAL